MDVDLQYSDSNINWNELSEMYRLAPLSDKSPEDLRIVFTNSRYKCFAFDNGVVVGAGRALADGKDCSYLCDVAVLPNYQGTGLGKKIVQSLIDQSKGHRKIILYANPGKESFYAKFGFKKMNTAMAIFENEQKMIEVGILSEL